jgi:hypothetical protein
MSKAEEDGEDDESAADYYPDFCTEPLLSVSASHPLLWILSNTHSRRMFSQSAELRRINLLLINIDIMERLLM